ncbi:hypothetical protein KIPB_001370, partial [Kipferlia bialata]|eukprot:g1370.t1
MGDKLSPELLYILSPHRGPISGVKFSPDGRTLAISSADATVSLYRIGDLDSATPPVPQYVGRLHGTHTQGISDLSWSPDSKSIVTVSDDSTAVIWDAEMLQ